MLDQQTIAARISGVAGATAWPSSSVVTFTTIDIDTYNMVTGINKITVPVSGLYRIFGQLSTTNAVGTGTGKDLDINIRKNGTTEILADFWTNEVSGSSAFVVLNSQGLFRLNAGDYIEILATRDANMAATLQTSSARCFLEVIRLGL